MEKIEKLRSFLESAPDDSFLNHALALEYIKIGQDAEAKKLFLAVLNRDALYIGSYYHLAKLFERINDLESAKAWYEKGMEAAKKTKDIHSFNELQAGYEDLTDG